MAVRLRAALDYLRRKIDGYDSTFEAAELVAAGISDLHGMARTVTAGALTDEMARCLLEMSCQCVGTQHECDSEIFDDCAIVLDGYTYSDSGRKRCPTEQELADARMRICDAINARYA